MITISHYASYKGFNKVFNLDTMTEAELSHIRDNFLWAGTQTRLSLRGSIALALHSADDKYSVRYLSMLMDKIRTKDLAAMTAAEYDAMAEVCSGAGYGSLADQLDDLADKARSKKKK
jgi:hypothetical protein